jgi:hypothetical protein
MILINIKFQIRPEKIDEWPIIYIDTPHDGFGPMGEIQPR